MLTINQYTKNWIPNEILTTTIKEIIYGGYFTALLGPSLVVATSILTNVMISLPLLIITYLIPLIVYSFDYYKDMEKDQDFNQERVAHLNRKKRFYPYLMLSYVLILTFLILFFSNWMMISFILFLVMVGVVYSFRIKSFTQKIPAFKNIYTVIIWSLAGSLSVVFFYQLQLNVAYFLICLSIFLKMLPNAIFFDLKDIKNDAIQGLKTIPVILGKEETIKLLQKMNILAFIPLLVGIYLNIIPIFAAILILFIFYSLYYLSKIKNEENKMNYYIFADAEFILWPVILFLGLIIF